MRISFNLKSKVTSIETDLEKIVEKGIDSHNVDWKEKFITKHNARKEFQDLKHSQKLELEQLKQNKKSWIEKRAEIKRQKEILKLEEKRRKERQERINIILAAIFFIIMMFICLIMASLGLE